MEAHVTSTGVSWFSRNGKDWSGRFPEMDAELMEIGPCVLDGEMCALDDHGHPDFSQLRSTLGYRQRGTITGKLTFYAFDLLAHGREDFRGYALSVRKQRLSELIENDADHIRLVEPIQGEGARLLQAACGLELEGIVSKRLDAPYKSGQRNDQWLKSKCRPSQEVVVGGWESRGASFKSLLAGVYEGGQLRYVGHLSTGFGAEKLQKLLPKLRALETDKPPFAKGAPPRKTSDVHWIEPKLVAAAEIAEWTSAGKLRQASYKGLRDDKSPKAVVREFAAEA
jgi:bifunctional non-homologous end joining protein LigD